MNHSTRAVPLAFALALALAACSQTSELATTRHTLEENWYPTSEDPANMGEWFESVGNRIDPGRIGQTLTVFFDAEQACHDGVTTACSALVCQPANLVPQYQPAAAVYEGALHDTWGILACGTPD